MSLHFLCFEITTSKSHILSPFLLICKLERQTKEGKKEDIFIYSTPMNIKKKKMEDTTMSFC